MSLSRCARNTHPKIRCANLGPRSALPIPAPSAQALPMLRMGHPKIRDANLGPRSALPIPAPSAQAQPMLRTGRPKIRCANLGPRFALPIPAPSARPLTKGALLRSVFRKVERSTAPLLASWNSDSGATLRSTDVIAEVAV
jgi:hypothetical protein